MGEISTARECQGRYSRLREQHSKLMDVENVLKEGLTV